MNKTIFAPFSKKSIISTTLFVFLMFLSACSAQKEVPASTAVIIPTSTAVPVAETFSDPFAYCAAIGTIDAPDAGYTGEKMPLQIIDGYKQAAGLQDSTEPMEMFAQTTTWRCMDGQVYACNVGANLPCGSKADTSKIPTQAMTDFCLANPASDFIPMVVTGRETVFSWHCVKGAAEILDQVETVDAAGYLAQIWYAISATQFSTQTPTMETTPAAVTPGMNAGILFNSNRGGAYADLYLLEPGSGQLTRLTQGSSNTFPGPFSPDGKQIIFTGFGLTNSYIGLMNADGSQPANLTNADVDEGFPAWSPDGKQIDFTWRRDGNNEIYIMDAEGKNSLRLTNNEKDDFAPVFSPDGTQIAFVSDRSQGDGIYSIYLMGTDGSHVQRLANIKGSSYTPVWSPDGTRIAFRSVQSGSAEIYVINIDGSGLTNLTNNPAEDWSPAWSADGTQIAFQTNRDGNWEIYVMNADGTEPLNITNNPADDQFPYWRH